MAWKKELVNNSDKENLLPKTVSEIKVTKMAALLKLMTAKKMLTDDTIQETKLNRVLTIPQLIFLGVGSTLGVGIYVLTGQVAKQQAGPAVCISFLIATIATIFSALCYAEFSSRVPRAGSAYVYSYVSVGQAMAYVIGWNLILEYIIGTASVAKGFSNYLDELISKRMSITLADRLPIDVTFMSTYPDIFAFGMSVLVAAVLAMGVRKSMKFNSLFTIINILVVVYVIICGFFAGNKAHWSIPASSNGTIGAGGFAPYGISGIMTGAATCFFGFVGFDAVATTGEEAKNPQRAIPISIMCSLIVVFFAYFGISTVLTLMVPYYMLNEDAPISGALEQIGWPISKWIVSIGALFGLSTALMGTMFPLPRVMYSMANDGLIFKCMGYVHPKFQTPFFGTLFAGVFAGVMAMLFPLNQLVNMMSIGTLMAYTLVAVSVLILRYRQTELEITIANNEEKPLKSYSTGDTIKQLFNCKRFSKPSSLSSSIASWAIFIYSVICITTTVFIVRSEKDLGEGDIWTIAIVSTMFISLLIMSIVIGRQPASTVKPKFMVPCVPAVPCMSIFINILLMMKLPTDTWYRFSVWMALGFLMYFLYAVPIWRRSFWKKLYNMDEPEPQIILCEVDLRQRNDETDSGHLNNGFQSDPQDTVNNNAN